jgi:hypothetical protein
LLEGVGHDTVDSTNFDSVDIITGSTGKSGRRF